MSAGLERNGDLSPRERSQSVECDAVCSPQVGDASANGEDVSSPAKSTPTSKGHGLRKWRRIRREFVKEGTVGSEAQLQKRRLQTQGDRQHSDMTVEPDVEAESSAASVESRIIGTTPAPPVSVNDIGLLLASSVQFTVGAADSENNEDWSSKLSTAGNFMNRMRHDSIGFGRERGSRVKGTGGRWHGHRLSAQKGVHGRAPDANREGSGDLDDKVEVDYSHSSVESDLRSPDIGIEPRENTAGNWKCQENSVSLDEERSDNGIEQHSEEVLSVYRKEDAVGAGTFKGDLREDCQQEDDGGVNCRLSPDTESFQVAIGSLQSAQSALEHEIQKFVNVGKHPEEPIEQEDDETDVTRTFDAQGAVLNEEIRNLERKIEAASATVKEKELQNGILVSKLDNLLQKKIEADIEFLVLTRTTQSWKHRVEDLMAPQNHMFLNELGEDESTAKMLEEQQEKLETQLEELSQTKDLLKLQNDLCRTTLCFFMQLGMIFIALLMFLFHMLAPAGDVVPT